MNFLSKYTHTIKNNAHILLQASEELTCDVSIAQTNYKSASETILAEKA